MVGTASTERLLEIAADRLKNEPAVLRADPEFFESLTADQTRLSREWTAYYEGKGPRPRTGKLP